MTAGETVYLNWVDPSKCPVSQSNAAEFSEPQRWGYPSTPHFDFLDGPSITSSQQAEHQLANDTAPWLDPELSAQDGDVGRLQSGYTASSSSSVERWSQGSELCPSSPSNGDEYNGLTGIDPQLLGILPPTSATSAEHGYEPDPSDRYCYLCEKDFRYPKDFRRHWTGSHSNDRPHKCPVEDCKYRSKGFVRKDNMNRHINKKHSG